MSTFQQQERPAKLLAECFPLWNELQPLQQEKLAASAVLRTFPQGAHIHNGSADCIGVLCVVSGTLRSYMLAENGREISLFSIGEKETCVLSASCILPLITFEIFIDAQTDAELLLIAPQSFSAIMQENPRVDAFAYRQTAERFSDVMWVFHQVLFVSFDKRLAAYLLEESAASAPRVLERTHETIAKDLGSAREVVSRMLKYFQQEKLIELSRGSITLRDEPRLRLLAYQR